MSRTIFLLIIIISSAFSTIDGMKDECIIKIRQVNLPYNGIYEYLINDSLLVIQKTGFSEKSSTTDIDRILLSKSQLDQIKSEILPIAFEKLEASYGNPIVIDGIHWQFEVDSKEYTLYYLSEELNKLIVTVNRMIENPENRIIKIKTD